MSTPTKNDDRHQVIEVKPDTSKEEAPPNRWWYWFRIEVPPKSNRPEFIIILLALIVLEVIIGPIFGAILRSIFGWPF